MTPEERKFLYETHAIVQNKLLPDIQDTKNTLQRIEDKLEDVNQSCTGYDLAIKQNTDDIKQLQHDMRWFNNKVLAAVGSVAFLLLLVVITLYTKTFGNLP